MKSKRSIQFENIMLSVVVLIVELLICGTFIWSQANLLVILLLIQVLLPHLLCVVNTINNIRKDNFKYLFNAALILFTLTLSYLMTIGVIFFFVSGTGIFNFIALGILVACAIISLLDIAFCRLIISGPAESDQAHLRGRKIKSYVLTGFLQLILLLINAFLIYMILLANFNHTDKFKFDYKVNSFAPSENSAYVAPGHFHDTISNYNGNGMILMSSDFNKFGKTVFTNKFEAYGLDIFKDTFIECGDSTIRVSKDAKIWSDIGFPTDDIYYSVAHNDDITVVIGSSGVILTSADLIEWSAHTLSTKETLNSVKWLNGSFIIVGDNGTILKSPDGLSWKSYSVKTEYALRDVTWGNGKYLIVGGEPEILPFEYMRSEPNIQIVLKSSDGENWTLDHMDNEQVLSATTYFNGRYFAGSTRSADYIRAGNLNGLFRSDTGSQWPNISAWPNAAIACFTTDGNNLYAAGDGIYKTNDGAKWEKTGDIKNITSIAVNKNGIFAALCKIGDIYTSEDGEEWIGRSSEKTYFKDAAFNGINYVAVGDALYSSSDAVEWVVVQDMPYNKVVYSGDRFFAINKTSKLRSLSDDLHEASDIETISGAEIRGIASNGSRYVAVGSKPLIMYSDDLITWEPVRFAAQFDDGLAINDIIWTGDRFAAVSNSSSLFTSVDGQNWDLTYIKSLNDYFTLAWGNGTYVLMSDKEIAVSSGGLNEWNIRKNPDYKYYNTDMIFNDGRFIMIGHDLDDFYGSSMISQSVDGSDWQEKSMSYGEYETRLEKILWDGRRYLLIGNMFK